MPESDIRFWPGVPDLQALGARTFEDLMGDTGALEGEERGEIVARDEARCVLRYPLPGTVTRAGDRPTRPRGAGTGFVYLSRWTAGSLRDKTQARLTAPRSSSFAAREWNLFCHLREHGVGTAQPLAMGEERAALFSQRSFLATRALELMQPLPEYLEANRDDDTRRRLAQALGLMFARIADARVELPQLSLASVFVARKQGGAACGSPVAGHPTRHLPQLALASVRGGRLHDEWSPKQAAKALQGLLSQVEAAWQVHRRDLQHVFHHSLGRRFTKSLRKELWSQPTPRLDAARMAAPQ